MVSSSSFVNCYQAANGTTTCPGFDLHVWDSDQKDYNVIRIEGFTIDDVLPTTKEATAVITVA